MTCRHGWLVPALLMFSCSSTSTERARATPDAGAIPVVAPDAGETPDTWASYARGFFATYCVSCHDAGDPTGRDYSVQATVARDMSVMRCGVAAAQDPSWNCPPSPSAKQFPIGSGPKPSDAERDRIVAWITGGEP